MNLWSTPSGAHQVEHTKVMLAYFDQLHAGVAVLKAVGVTRKKVFRGRKGEPLPVLAFRLPHQGTLRISATAKRATAGRGARALADNSSKFATDPL